MRPIVICLSDEPHSDFILIIGREICAGDISDDNFVDRIDRGASRAGADGFH
jgi:hypothetical protein